MKYVIRLFAAVVVIATILTFTSVRPAHAACTILNVDGASTGFVDVVVGHSLTVYATLSNGTSVSGFPVTLIAFMTPVSFGGLPAGSRLVVVDNDFDCGPAATSFNPGDGRINGKPGDRLVVYCNTGGFFPNVDIYAIAPGGEGKHLAQILASDLLKPNFSLNLGSNGLVTGKIDINSVGYVALQGGPYGGTATGDWLKIFSCKAS